MKITERKCKQIVGGAAAAALLLSGVHLPGAAWKEVKADTVSVNAKITKELINKRNRFLKQFALSDGSFTAVAYSMPVHYKKKGVWKEIDTTMKKVGKKKYQTKSTDLTIQVSKKSNKKFCKKYCIIRRLVVYYKHRRLPAVCVMLNAEPTVRIRDCVYMCGCRALEILRKFCIRKQRRTVSSISLPTCFMRVR